MAIKLCCHNEGKLILRALFARLPDGSSVLVRYYLLVATQRRRAGYTLGIATHFWLYIILQHSCTELEVVVMC